MKCLKKLIAIAGAVMISNSIIFSASAIKISPNVKNTNVTAKNIRKTLKEIEDDLSMTRAVKNKRKMAVLEQELPKAVETTNALIESAHKHIKSRLDELTPTSEYKGSGMISNLIESTSSSLQKLKSTLDNFYVENIYSTMIIYNYVNNLQRTIQPNDPNCSTIDMIRCLKHQIESTISNIAKIAKGNSDNGKISSNYTYSYKPVTINSVYIPNNSTKYIVGYCYFVNNNFPNNNINLNNNNNSMKLDTAEVQKECDDLCALIEETIEKGIENINQDIDD